MGYGNNRLSARPDDLVSVGSSPYLEVTSLPSSEVTSSDAPERTPWWGVVAKTSTTAVALGADDCLGSVGEGLEVSPLVFVPFVVPVLEGDTG